MTNLNRSTKIRADQIIPVFENPVSLENFEGFVKLIEKTTTPDAVVDQGLHLEFWIVEYGNNERGNRKILVWNDGTLASRKDVPLCTYHKCLGCERIWCYTRFGNRSKKGETRVRVDLGCKSWREVALLFFAEICNRCDVKKHKEYRTCEICPKALTIKRLSETISCVIGEGSNCEMEKNGVCVDPNPRIYARECDSWRQKKQ